MARRMDKNQNERHTTTTPSLGDSQLGVVFGVCFCVYFCFFVFGRKTRACDTIWLLQNAHCSLLVSAATCSVSNALSSPTRCACELAPATPSESARSASRCAILSCSATRFARSELSRALVCSWNDRNKASVSTWHDSRGTPAREDEEDKHDTVQTRALFA